MSISRRGFVAGAAAVTLGRVAPLHGFQAGEAAVSQEIPAGFDPWIEVDVAALRHNVGVVSRLSGNRPILAVIKNNGYGLGVTQVAVAIEAMPEIAGFAVVKAEAALRLRDAGITKPVLLMALFDDETGAELASRGVSLALTTDDGGERLARATRRAGRAVTCHAYLDTGMSRMGVPYHRASEWLRTLSASGIRLQGVFTGFTEDADFDPEQLRRFLQVTDEAASAGVEVGRRHAASSNGVFHLPDAHLDMVRPGIALFGAYPSDWEAERQIAELTPAMRLRARVVRVEQLRPGDGVSYGRNYIADRPTWIATIPVGHTDGYPRQAVNGAQVLINSQLYPVIGAVSASHTIIEVGAEQSVHIGDEVTLLGPDHPAIGPNAIAAATGRSVYDVLMHLNPALPRITLRG